MKILVTGVGGQLGTDVMIEAVQRSHDVLGTGHILSLGSLELPDLCGQFRLQEMDLTEPSEVTRVLDEYGPDCIVHCAAWTNVDLAEDPQWKDEVYKVNVTGTKLIAEYCRDHNTSLLYISTDYVFGGHGETPWSPDCKEYHPLNYYGFTKLEGEKIVSEMVKRFFILRTSWVYSTRGKNFVNTMLTVGKEREKIYVVSDQIGCPAFTNDLSRLIIDMIETDKYGFYHATNTGGYISWYDFAVEIFRQASQMDSEHYYPGHPFVIPVTTEMYSASGTARPLNSRLDQSGLIENGFLPLPDWKDALHRCLVCRFLKEQPV